MLFAYPTPTALNRLLPKSTMYQNVAPTTEQRELFTQQVNKIIWAHKLAPDTLNVAASEQVLEIQVIKLVVKRQITTIGEAVLQYLDKAIPSALLFEVCYPNEQVQMAACLKQTNVNGRLSYSSYLYGEHTSATAERKALPISKDFEHLYHQLLASLLAYPLHTGEHINAALLRVQEINKLERRVQQLEKQLHNKNTQFNKRVELNQQLQRAKQEHTTLLTPH